jgi:hypothetical protein
MKTILNKNSSRIPRKNTSPRAIRRHPRELTVRDIARSVASGNKQLFRVQFEVTETQLQKIEELLLQFSTVITNKRELFGNALSLLKWAVEERKQGREIGSQDALDRQFHRILLPALDDIQPMNKQSTNA